MTCPDKCIKCNAESLFLSEISYISIYVVQIQSYFPCWFCCFVRRKIYENKSYQESDGLKCSQEYALEATHRMKVFSSPAYIHSVHPFSTHLWVSWPFSGPVCRQSTATCALRAGIPDRRETQAHTHTQVTTLWAEVLKTEVCANGINVLKRPIF